MSKIRFPKSNCLRIINNKDYSRLENDETRLYYDFEYPSISNNEYFQKILQSDGLWIQYRTNYGAHNCYLVDETGTETDISSYITTGSLIANGTTQHQLTHPLTGLTGKYFIRFDFNTNYEVPEAIFQSEWFEIVTEIPEGFLKIEYQNNSNPTYNDGIIWSEPQILLIEGRICESKFGNNSSVFETETFKMLTTEAHPNKTKIFEIELTPDYLIETLALALKKEYFWINGVRFNTDSEIDVSQVKDTRFYAGNVELRVVEDVFSQAYEDYTDDAEIEGDLPVLPLRLRTTGLQVRTTGLVDRKINN